MKHIKKFNEGLEISYTNEDIEEIFFDLTDQGTKLYITDLYLTNNNKVIKVTPYLKNPKTTRHCKLAKLIIKNDPNGIDLGIEDMGLRTMTNIDLLDDIISRIKRFYSMLDKQQPNFIINNDYNGINVIFVVIGDFISEELSKTELVDKHLISLKDALKVYKNYRIKINGNWLEMGGKDSAAKKTYLEKIKRGLWDVNHVIYSQSKSISVLVDWYNKLREDGLDFKIALSDTQLVVQIF